MALPKARPRGGVLVASASRGTTGESEYARRKGLSWQQQALEYSRSVPELSFASRFYSRMLKQVRYFPARLRSDGTLEEIKTGPPVERLRQIRDPGGGMTQLNSQYGRLMFITGEGVLFGRGLETPRERWSFVWTDEIEIVTDGEDKVIEIVHMPNGSGGKKTSYSPKDARAYPMWTPSPELSGDADSPMRAVLDIAQELLILTDAIYATATSRIQNGIVFLPTEASPGPVEADADEDPEEDPFVSDLGEHLTAQSENPRDPAHRVPMFAYLDGDLIQKILHLKLHNPETDYLERELRKEARATLGLGLDMPPEALSGLGQSNHWSAIQILGDMWKSHGLNVALQFASDLAEVYLRPGLEEDGFAEWEDIVIGVDGSQITQKADRSDDVKTAAGEGWVGPSGGRRLLNISEDYKPTDEELEFMLEWKGKQPAPEAPRERETNGDAPGAPAPPGPEGDSGRRTRVVAAAFREMGAAEVALMRCRELAGMRLRNQKVWKALEAICVDCADQANGTSHALVAHVLGPERLQQLRLDPATLVKGGADSLRDVLIGWGYPETQARALAEMVELFAARSLFDERTTLPSGFEAQIVRTKEMFDAVEHRAA